MPSSPARIEANRRNSALSTGPKEEGGGKERSRQNSLKHGLTGAGVVLASVDAGEVERRAEALMVELDPQTEMGQILVRQMAMLSVRMERAAKHETSAVARHVRHAIDDFDEQRLDEADRLFDALGDQPRSHLRKLRKSPEGVDRLLDAWLELREALTGPADPAWTETHRERAENLNGRRPLEAIGSRFDALAKATRGDFSGLGDTEGANLGREQRRAWARVQLIGRVDEEIAKLEAHYETLDFDAIDLDRAEAPGRALFDPSKDAALARRYESESSRRFFKALKDLREVEAAAAEAPGPVATPEPDEDCEPLASLRVGRFPAPRDPRPAPSPARVVAVGVDFRPVGRPGREEMTSCGSA